MGADTVSLSGLEKDVYEQAISEGVNNSFDLKEFFSIEEAQWNGGAGQVWNHHHGRNTSPFFANELGAFPIAGNQTSSKGRIGMKKIMGRISMSEEAMDDLVSSEASFRNGMTDEKTRLIDDLGRKENQSIGMDGRGVLALINEATGPSGVLLNLDAPGNIAGSSYGNRFLDVNMFVAAVNPATGQIRTSIKQIATLSATGATATTTAGTFTGWVDNDYVVQAANASVTDVLDTSFEAAPWGLPALVDDGTNRDNYFGILRSVVPSLQSYVVASLGAMSVDAAQRMSDVVFQRLGGIINAVAMHPSTRREWLKIQDADRRYSGSDLSNPNVMTKAFTQGTITVDDVKVTALRSIGLAQVYFLDTAKSGFSRYMAEPGKFMDKDGAMWVRQGTGASAVHGYEATYFRRFQNFCRRPGLNGRWDGVTGQTLVIVRDL
jgi:hypothetical protein